jgi:hypothetical protein
MPVNTKRFLSRGLLIAVLVFFLMPFLTLSCGGAKLVSMSGVNMVVGTTLTSKDPFTDRVKKQEIKPEPMVALALAAAVVAFGIGFFAGKGKGPLGSMVASGACALLLLLAKFKVDADVVKQGQGVVTAEWEMGFWLALLASLALVGLYFLPDVEKAEVSATPVPAPGNE